MTAGAGLPPGFWSVIVRACAEARAWANSPAYEKEAAELRAVYDE